MTIKYVDTTSLNFRDKPKLDSNIIASLHLGTPVDVGGSGSGQFVEAVVDISGTTTKGFISDRFLRDPVSDGREALIAAAVTEWKRFDFGIGKENKKPYAGFVGEMWKALGMNLDGFDTDVPWSAAAISFMVRNAGKAPAGSLYGDFRFAAAHSRYVHDAIKRRNSSDKTAPFWGFDLDEAKPRLGDLVCRSRAGSNVDFDHASRRDSFKSHCDIIVSIPAGGGTVVALGGNVSNSVKATTYDLTAGGFLDNTKNVYAILVNRH
jgi:hypothetical protein